MTDSRPDLVFGVIGSVEGEFSEADGGVLVCGSGIVVFCEAGADEEDVADLDVTALGCGADVEALVFADCYEVVVGDAVGCGGVVFDSLFGGPAAVVEED